VLRAATVIDGEAGLAWELFLSLHAVRERLARLQAKLRTAGDAVARALHKPAEPVEEYPAQQHPPADRSKWVRRARLREFRVPGKPGAERA